MSTGEIVLALVRPLHAQLCSACEDGVSDTEPGEANARGPSRLRGPVARPGVPLSHTRSSASEEPTDEPRLQSPGRKRRAQSHSYSSSHGGDSRPSLQSFVGNGAPSHGKGTRSDRRRMSHRGGSAAPRGYPARGTGRPRLAPGPPCSRPVSHHTDDTPPGLRTEQSRGCGGHALDPASSRRPAAGVDAPRESSAGRTAPPPGGAQGRWPPAASCDPRSPGPRGGPSENGHAAFTSLRCRCHSSVTVRRPGTTQLSKSLSQPRPLKASFYGGKVGTSPWAVSCIPSHTPLFPQHASSLKNPLPFASRSRPPED